MADPGSPASGSASAPDGLPPRQEELSRRVRDSIRARRAETIDRLGPEPVLWLAIPPLWVVHAAEGTGFPASPLSGFLTAARERDYCKFGYPAFGDPDLAFWMPDELRPVVTEILGGRPGISVTGTAREIAGRIASLPAASLPVTGLTDGELPGALAAWARLAVQDDPYAALARRVPETLSCGDLSAVQDLLTAARSLPAAFGPGGEDEAALLGRALRAPRPGSAPARHGSGRRPPPDSRPRRGGQRA